MTKQSLKKAFAFIITVIMFFALPNFANAQKKCPHGQFLDCDSNGKHCMCLSFPPPCRGCGIGYSENIIPVNETSLSGFTSLAFNFKTEDAGSSRLYAYIHYQPSINAGLVQAIQTAQSIVSALSF